jgi:hypothetical protein
MSLIEMPFDDSIRALESEYYEIVYRFKTIATKNGEERWMGQARVRRKDTGETVKAGCTVFGPDRAFVEQGIIEKLKQTMKDLGIPHGWQTRTRKLLVRYLAFESKIMEFRTLVKALSENLPREGDNFVRSGDRNLHRKRASGIVIVSGVCI